MFRSVTAALCLALLVPLSACNDEPDIDPRSCDAPGNICTWAGKGEAAFNGDNQPRKDAYLYWPVDIKFTKAGDAYILDWNNHQVRQLTADDTLRTVLGTDFVGDGDPDTADLTKPGVMGTRIDLNHPTQLLEEADGSLLLVAWHNHKLRRFDPATGMAYVWCGRGAGFAGDGDAVSNPDLRLNQPSGATLDRDGNVYLLDQRNQRIRKLHRDGSKIETVAGTGEPGYSGDGGDPLKAQFNFPTGSNPPPAGTLTIDTEGRLYIADTLNHAIRRVDFTTNTIETVVGTGTAGFSGDDGPATAAQINNPRDLELGPDGRIYIADELNHRIRALDLTTDTISTVAGNGEEDFSGDRGPATAAALNRPAGIDFDAEGRLFIADTYNHRIRVVTPL